MVECSWRRIYGNLTEGMAAELLNKANILAADNYTSLWQLTLQYWYAGVSLLNIH